MNKRFCLLTLFLMIQPAMSDTATDDFWEHCPGPACPANAPQGSADLQKEERYDHKHKHEHAHEHMDNKANELPELHEKIKEIHRKER